MKSRKFISTIAMLLFFVASLSAQNYYTAKDGNWQSQNTWLNKDKPDNGWSGHNTDTIFVNHNLKLNQFIAIDNYVIIISDTGSISGNA
ncbi:MAG: hypothetical protein R6T91_07870, partial [Bacteroidales bacterium]